MVYIYILFAIIRLMLFVLLSCSQTPEQPWLWKSVDPHVHSSLGSNDTDGYGTPDFIKQAMDQAGLDYIFLTDHSNSLGSMSCEDVEDCPNQGPELTRGAWDDSVIRATELSPRAEEDSLSQPTGHIGCIPKIRNEWQTEAFVDRPFGSILAKDVIEQCREANGWVILNHPFGPTPWVAFDHSHDDFDAIEVFNGGAGFDASDMEAIEFWEEGIQNNKRWIPVGGSDCHRWGTSPPGGLLDSALGWPKTDVRVNEGESIEQAFFSGRVVVSDPTTSLRYWVENKEKKVGPGERITGPATLHYTIQTQEENLWVFIKDGAGEVLLHEELKDSTTGQLEVGEGMYWMRVLPSEFGVQARGAAVGMPIWVD